MIEYRLQNWAAFHSTIEQIRSKYGTHTERSTGRTEKNEILYRGQSNCDWGLDTTLERTRKGTQYSLYDYHFIALKHASEIESVTGKALKAISITELDEFDRTHWKNEHASFLELPCYSYLVYLRHHGFPSPLLDWTASPYIAAYFAFCERNDCERIAVFAFVETPRGTKTQWGGAPIIQSRGPYVSTHSRHFAQQSQYTIATKWFDKSETHVFCHHREVLDHDRDDQDLAIKITIPASERPRALRDLNDFGINHFTLFQSEDALIRHVSAKAFDLER